MKMLYAAFDNLFGGGKSYGPMPESSPSPVTVTSFSQPNVLRSRMTEERMSHGGTITANLSPVRLDMDHGPVVMYFCPMRHLNVLNVLTEGDGGVIPTEAKVEGLQVPSHFRSGLYELENVELTSNGTIQVKATEKTSWKFIGVYQETIFPD